MTLLLLLLPVLGHAEATYQVETRGYPPSAFSAKDVSSRAIPARTPRPEALPSKAARDTAFAEVPGLGESVLAMDQLDRDLLYVRARNIPLKELTKTYPAIPAQQLRQLRQNLAGGK